MARCPWARTPRSQPVIRTAASAELRICSSRQHRVPGRFRRQPDYYDMGPRSPLSKGIVASPDGLMIGLDCPGLPVGSGYLFALPGQSAPVHCSVGCLRGAGSWVTLLHGFPNLPWDWPRGRRALVRSPAPDARLAGSVTGQTHRSHLCARRAYRLIEALWPTSASSRPRSSPTTSGYVAQDTLARQSTDHRLPA